jgi:hypothetical protein
MTFLVCLTIADLFIAVGYLTGAIRFIGADDTDSMPTRVLACHQGKDPGCIFILQNKFTYLEYPS